MAVALPAVGVLVMLRPAPSRASLTARADRSVREIVDEALAAWLERLEDAEDAAAAAEALAEYERDGGVAADEFFRVHAAETRATYGSSGEV